MAIKLDRKSPGVVGAVFGMGAGLVLGAMLAMLNLAAQPVEVVKAMPKEPKPGVRYFVTGAPGGGAGSGWQRKAEQIDGGRGEIGFTENELNAWSAATFPEPKVKDEDKQSPLLLVAGTPNFRFAGKDLQLGMVNKIFSFGTEIPLVLHATGDFEKTGGRWHFVAKESYLGGLPLHRVRALAGPVARGLGVGDKMPATVEKLLASANRVGVSGDEFVVEMP
jgi:hypothetical protein